MRQLTKRTENTMKIDQIGMDWIGRPEIFETPPSFQPVKEQDQKITKERKKERNKKKERKKD